MIIMSMTMGIQTKSYKKTRTVHHLTAAYTTYDDGCLVNILPSRFAAYTANVSGNTFFSFGLRPIFNNRKEFDFSLFLEGNIVGS